MLSVSVPRCTQALKHIFSRQLNLSGVFPPIVTPFNDKEELLLDQLRNNVNKWKSKGFQGYTVLGSNGEFQYLSLDEKIKLVQTVKGEEPNKLILVGAGHESTKLTIEQINSLSAAGGSAALIYSPCFYKGSMTAAAFYQHYFQIAEQSQIPVIIYNVPANTGIDIPLDVVVSLAEHENIIGIKESGGNVVRIGAIAHQTRHANFQIIAGSASFMLPAYSVGAVGTVAALANVMGEEVVALHNAIMAKNDCIDLQHRLIAPNTAVTSTFGIAGLKYVCDYIGLYGGPCRSPIQPLSQEQKSKLTKIMDDAGIKMI